MRVLALVACLGLMATFHIRDTLAMEGSGSDKTPEYRLFPQERFLGTFPMRHPVVPSDSRSREELDSARSSASGLKHNDQFPWNLKYKVPWGNLRQSVLSSRTLADIAEFEKDGRKYGPFTVGLSHFEPKPYPIGFPHISRPEALRLQRPVNFEDYAVSYKKGFQFAPGAVDFSMEPGLLRDIQAALHKLLEQSGRQPEFVSGTPQLKQGDYLWPPVQVSAKEPKVLDMHPRLKQHLHEAARFALRMSRSEEPPKIYHLQVPSARYGYRHIMMLPGDPVKFTTMHEPSANSEFWFMNEVMADGEKSPTYLNLGGTFLPKDFPEILGNAGDFRPAFQHLFEYRF
ncbi:uncharacterized protein UTRI_10402_B [Ustilago trichophora]|uniref:Effector family protein Eff1 n=1 Tax=Ustilago trichophora TaxID=86804 RepID=A0A5C3E8B9_9BASI|nr:uncharacterized protein UTRI_10402_B [Ustilago trichophora]